MYTVLVLVEVLFFIVVVARLLIGTRLLPTINLNSECHEHISLRKPVSPINLITCSDWKTEAFITKWLGSCRCVGKWRYVPFFPDRDLSGQMIGHEVFNGFSFEIVDRCI